MESTRPVVVERLLLGAVGALAGLCLYVTLDLLPDRMPQHPRLVLTLATLAGTFFTACLALAGPLRLPRAVGASALLALADTALLAWAGGRFADPGDFIETGHPVVALAILTLVPLPFVISRAVEGRWIAYPALFAHSWDIVVRYAAAWVFVGVVWGVVMLSDALLGLVGLDIIERLIDIDMVPFLLTGFTLGVALAVVNELSDYVSPFLVLRLLRLLLPVVLVVVLIFLAVLPFRGLSGLFGTFSAAATLLAMAIGTATLVTTALDADESGAVQAPAMRWAVQAMALALPALAGLGALAVWERVAQYGWTPDRLAAATVSLVVLAYGLAYAVTVLLRRDWSARIRRINVGMALVVLAVAAAWLTPAFDPQRISTASQIARLRSGAVAADQLDLWSMGRDWGRAGRAGLDRLAALDDPRLAPRLAALAEADTRSAFESGGGAGLADRIEGLRRRLPVRPEGAAVPQALLDGFAPWEVEQTQAACARTTEAGDPGCLLLLVELSAQRPGPEAVLVTLGPGGGLDFAAYMARASGDVFERRVATYLDGRRIAGSAAIAALEALRKGGFGRAPVEVWALRLDGTDLFFGP